MVEADMPSFMNYKSGIITDDNCDYEGVDHCVLIVGYDDTGSVPYFIVQNNWGAGWGEKGYVRLG